MTALSKELHAYYRSVAASLPCAGCSKKKYLNDLYTRLFDLQTEQPDADRQTACERFGTVEEIVQSWMENISASDYKRNIAFSNRTKRLIAGGAALAGIGLCLLGGFYGKHRSEVNGDVLVNYSIAIFPQGKSRWDILCATAEAMGITVEEAIEQEAKKKNISRGEYLQLAAAQDDMTLNEYIEKHDLKFDDFNDEKE